VLREIIFMSNVRKNGGCIKCEFSFRFDGNNKYTIGARQIKFVTYVHNKNLYETLFVN
jgi:hypothetical protein